MDITSCDQMNLKKSYRDHRKTYFIWVVVKIMVPFCISTIIRHLIFRVPKRKHNFDNHPYQSPAQLMNVASGEYWLWLCYGLILLRAVASESLHRVGSLPNFGGFSWGS